jgi:hypothetical protein
MFRLSQDTSSCIGHYLCDWMLPFHVQLDLEKGMMDCLYVKCKLVAPFSCFQLYYLDLCYPSDAYTELHISFLTNSALLWRHPLYHWLCYGWAWEAWTEISCGFEVCSYPIVIVLFDELSLCKCVIWSYVWLVFNVVQFCPLILVFFVITSVSESLRTLGSRD